MRAATELPDAGRGGVPPLLCSGDLHRHVGRAAQPELIRPRLAPCSRRPGSMRGEVLAMIDDPAVKDALKQATEAAVARGVVRRAQFHRRRRTVLGQRSLAVRRGSAGRVATSRGAQAGHCDQGATGTCDAGSLAAMSAPCPQGMD
ncbi:hypothetical protein ACU4GD_07825 [Cupriavidus basilensis]